MGGIWVENAHKACICSLYGHSLCCRVQRKNMKERSMSSSVEPCPEETNISILILLTGDHKAEYLYSCKNHISMWAGANYLDGRTHLENRGENTLSNWCDMVASPEKEHRTTNWSGGLQCSIFIIEVPELSSYCNRCLC